MTARRQPSNIPAGNVNTIDEVLDSSWFTNRVGAESITPERLARGPNSDPGPAPEKWVLLREKSAGTNPGFTARDANGRTWFVQFDIPEFPEGGTGAVEIATKLFWALGYNQIQTFITTFDPARVEIDPQATAKRPSGARTPYTRDDLKRVLERAAPNADGTYRVSAGALLPGKVLGPFRYSGTRSDDPNDLGSARAAPRAARAARLRRMDQSGRLEGGEHAGRARGRTRSNGREALPPGRGLHVRHGQQPS